IPRPNSQRPSNTFYFLHQLRPNGLGMWSADIQLGERGEEGGLYWLVVISSDPSLTGPVSVKDLSDGSMQGPPPDFDRHPLIRMKVVRGPSNSAAHDKCHSYAAVSMH